MNAACTRRAKNPIWEHGPFSAYQVRVAWLGWTQELIEVQFEHNLLKYFDVTDYTKVPKRLFEWGRPHGEKAIWERFRQAVEGKG